MCTFSFIEHAIGAPDVAVSFELQANPGGQEGSQEVEVQQAGLEEPEEEVEPESRAGIVRERQAPEHYKSPSIFESLLNMLYLLMH